MLLPSYTYLLLVLCILFFINITIVRVNILPFNIDQLIGSSSGELTAVLHWHNMGPAIVNIITIHHIKIIYLLVASVFCVAAVLVSHSLFNHYLDTTPVNTVNPVKLIVRVLCYARKHKYPENRSALTYWEEEAPSRLDLGKNKYGGPFTEEEVEDVKTVLRLIPLVVVCTVASGLFNEYTLGLRVEGYGCTGSDESSLSAYDKLLLAKPKIQLEFNDKFNQRFLVSTRKSGTADASFQQMFGIETLSLEFLGTRSYDYLIKALVENPALCEAEVMKVPDLACHYSEFKRSLSQNLEMLQSLKDISSAIKESAPHVPFLFGESLIVATAFMEEFRSLRKTLAHSRSNAQYESILICLALHDNGEGMQGHDSTLTKDIHEDIIHWLSGHFEKDLTCSFINKFFSLSPQTLAYTADKSLMFKETYLSQLILITDLISISSANNGPKEDEIISHWLSLTNISVSVRDSIMCTVEKKVSGKNTGSSIWHRLLDTICKIAGFQ
uniref:Uncharacterized protein n=1 Tax=Amphimedon queenslandica TaxID=400682 RepID=A0A1X7UME0_AMPQE